jgi:hypothetical protein
MKIRFYIFFILVLIASCSGDSDSPDLNNPVDLDGHWISNCYLDDDDYYKIDEFIFNGNTFETSYQTWDNENCEGDPVDSDSGEGTFSVGDLITTPSSIYAYEIDFEVDYNGSTFTILDLIHVEGDVFYFGEYIHYSMRPTDIDFNIALTRQ